MAYEICKKCQRFFEKNGKCYCEKCDNELTESHGKINSYLEYNPHASILEIVKDTGVKLKDVNIFLEAGGVISVGGFSNESTINLRQEEIKKEEELRDKKESVKMKNKFTPRRLRK